MITYDALAAQHIELSYNTEDIKKQRHDTLQLLSVQAHESVLDIGCGTGFLLEELAEKVTDQGQVIGIDNSHDMLSIAAKRCESYSNVTLMQGHAESLAIDSHSVDVVTCTQVLLYVTNLDQALREIYRVLKPGGRFVIVETDWRGVIINNHSEALTRQMFDALDAALENPHLPSKLHYLLRQKEFQEIAIHTIPIINTTLNAASFSFSILHWVAKQAVLRGAVTEDTAKQWLNELTQLSDQGKYFFSINRFLFLGRKPIEHPQ